MSEPHNGKRKKAEIVTRHPLAEWGKLIAVLTALTGGVSYWQQQYVHPVAVEAARHAASNAVEAHEARPHAGVLTRQEFQTWMQQRDRSLDRFSRELLDRMRSIEQAFRQRGGD